MTKTEISAIKSKLKANERVSLSNFNKAGRMFDETGMTKQAAQCYFSGKDY